MAEQLTYVYKVTVRADTAARSGAQGEDVELAVRERIEELDGADIFVWDEAVEDDVQYSLDVTAELDGAR